MGTLQAQYAPAMYVGLLSRIEGFARGDLDRALERRTVVQATLMRQTIHLVSRADYWPLALAVREARRPVHLRTWPDPPAEGLAAAAQRLRDALADGPMWRRDLEALIGKDAFRGAGLWVDLVRVPPGGTWDRRRADRYGLAEQWLGPPPAGIDAEAHLVRRYLTGHGPASRHDVASFTALPLGAVDAVLGRLRVRHLVAEDGTALVDLARAPLPDPDTPAPVRLLGHWDAVLLAHARRAGVLPDEYRARIFNTRRPHSTSVFLVDGMVAGEWALDGSFEPYRKLDASTRRELGEELERVRAL